MIDPILYLKGNHDFGSANFNQQLLERVLADGSYDRHVARLNGVVSPQVCRSSWRRWRSTSERLDAEVHWTRPEGGLFVWMTVPEGLDTGFDGPLFPRCVREGVLYVPGRVRLRRRAGAPAEEPHPAHLRRAQRGRAGRGGAPAGGGPECVPGPGRLTPAPRIRGPASRRRLSGSERLTGGKDADTGAVALKILQRYVIGEVVRAFSLALLTMTAIFVLFMVVAEARDIGLSPQDIVELVPYVIPSTLPYTIPVSLLFAVTVVYGRLAGDNEIIAVKTAGLSVMTILWPTFVLAIALSVAAALS